MFILVNYSDDFGLDTYGTFDTKKEAFESIADVVNRDYADCDIMSMYPFDDIDDCELYSYGRVSINAGSDWCNCHNGDLHDYWLIIEV